MKEYFCIGSYLPFQSINKSQLNTSTAKQTFSFGKSKRFSQFKANCSVVAYSNNQFKAKKQGAKIGSSQRQPIVVINQNPDPARYRIKTQPSQHNNFSFGLGRQHVKAYDYLNIQANKYPSSTKYQVQQNIKKIYAKSPIYSMRKKYKTQRPEDTSPGPARYHVLTGKNSNLTLTKYKSISFSTGKCRRFQASQTQPPGPGAYKQFNGNDSRIGGGNSRYHSASSTKFPHAKRKTYIDDEAFRKSSLPGPGNYKSPSQFGQYDGDIYKTFQFSGKRPSDIIYLDIQTRNSLSQKAKRPLTSKH